MHDSAKEQAVNLIIQRKDEILQEKEELARKIAQLSARNRELDRALADCVSAARVFDYTLELPEPRDAIFRVFTSLNRNALNYAAHNVAIADLFEKSVEQAKPSAVIVEKRTIPKIRDVVLDRLSQAGASGSKAAPIQEFIENTYQIKIHPKTVGMTLYRLLKEGYVRREGHTWFVVQQNAETMNPGGDAPGSVTSGSRSKGGA